MLKNRCTELLMLLMLFSCTQAYAAKLPGKEFVVSVKDFTTTLYYSGIVKPLKVSNISSPAESVVMEKHFEYGQMVKQGDVLLKLNSAKLQSDYHAALTGFLKAKEAYTNSRSKFKGIKELWDEGIISRNEFIAVKSENDSNYVAYQQALYQLDETVKTGQHLSENLKQLDISDKDAVDKALKIKYNYVNIVAPTNGVALFPHDKATQQEIAKKIAVGNQVKFGELLLQIGDMRGLSILIDVNEVDVLKLKPGQDVSITGVAFPGITLVGKLARIDSQASAELGAAGGLPTFPVTIEIPNLTPQQSHKIRVGMSVKVKMELKNSQAIAIPIKAVKQKEDKPYVQLINNGKVEERFIETGQTTQDSVEVKSGLKNGDRILIPNE